VQRQRLESKVYSAINCRKRENKLKKKGKHNVKAQQSCSYIDDLSVTWLAKRGAIRITQRQKNLFSLAKQAEHTSPLIKSLHIAFLFQAVRECLMGVDYPKINTTSEERMAAEILTALFGAEKRGQGLEKTV
jgi:hypothetical protein